MSTLSTENRRAQAGFTLVELAIVLVIVGLLIGGILKGQELIGATRVNSTVSQAKAIEAAAYTFSDTFGGKPGDLANAATRVPNCAVDKGCAAGTGTQGNGQIEGGPLLAPAVGAGATTEATAFFNQLYAADLISGLTTGGADAATLRQNVLNAPLDSGSNWRMGYQTSDIAGAGGTTDSNAHYMALSTVALDTDIATTAIEGAGILPKQASAMDAKIDDGQPGTGSVRGYTAGGTADASTECQSGDGATDTYNTQNTDKDCGLLIKALQ